MTQDDTRWQDDLLNAYPACRAWWRPESQIPGVGSWPAGHWGRCLCRQHAQPWPPRARPSGAGWRSARNGYLSFSACPRWSPGGEYEIFTVIIIIIHLQLNHRKHFYLTLTTLNLTCRQMDFFLRPAAPDTVRLMLPTLLSEVEESIEVMEGELLIMDWPLREENSWQISVLRESRSNMLALRDVGFSLSQDKRRGEERGGQTVHDTYFLFIISLKTSHPLHLYHPHSTDPKSFVLQIFLNPETKWCHYFTNRNKKLLENPCLISYIRPFQVNNLFLITARV